MNSTSPDQGASCSLDHARKRRRTALSCFHCRKRKLRCDREYPSCGRCRRGGNSDSCTYAEGRLDVSTGEGELKSAHDADEDIPRAANPVSIGSAITVPTDAPVQLPENVAVRLAMQDERIALLEKRLSGFEAAPAPRRDDSRILGRNPIEMSSVCTDVKVASGKGKKKVDQMFFKGKGYKTWFYGPSMPTSVLGQFPEVRKYIHESIKPDVSLMQAVTDMRAYKTRHKREKAGLPHSQEASLLNLIPDKAATDTAVKLYLDSLEHVYHILHLPSFWKQYNTLWRTHDQCAPGFVPVLLLMLATVSCVGLEEPLSYNADSSTPRERAIVLIQACETWLQRQSKKHRTVEILQVYCLLQIAKEVNSVNLKQTWISAGYMLRVALTAGLHRDPSLLVNHSSCFDGEIRRRLWVVMAELELQASTDRGMPSALAAINMDCNAPLNIDDEDLVEANKTLPEPKPDKEHTSASFLHISYRSLRLRTTFNVLVNDSSSDISYDEVLQYDEDITKELAALPKWAPSNVSSNSQMLSRFLLDIQLRQFLILLHSPFVGGADSSSRATFSRAVCVNAAVVILEYHHQLMSAGHHLLHFLRSDCYRAAMSIFHTTALAKPTHGDFLVQNMSTSSLSMIEKALVIMESKIIRTGRGQLHFLFITAAYALMRSSGVPDFDSRLRDEMIDRYRNVYCKLLAAQEVPLNATTVSNDDAIANSESEPQMGVSEHQRLGEDPFLGTYADGLEDWGFGNLSGWMSDDIWAFHPASMQ